jgi:hypothetical protein
VFSRHCPPFVFSPVSDSTFSLAIEPVSLR